MPKPKIWFDLTYDQADALMPLFDQALTAYQSGHPGVIILQPKMGSAVYGDFIPEKYAVRIIEILKELADERD